VNQCPAYIGLIDFWGTSFFTHNLYGLSTQNLPNILALPRRS
jgi:hypothetical protein